MLQLVWKKICNKRWMALCLLLGNILLTAAAAGTPIYSEAVLQRALTTTMAQSLQRSNKYPLQISVKGKMPAGEVFATDRNQQLKKIQQLLELPERSQAPVRLLREEYYIETKKAVLYSAGQERNASLAFGSIDGAEAHYTLLEGRNAVDTIGEDGIVEGVIHRELQRQLNLQVGDEIELLNYTVSGHEGRGRLRIVGIFNTDAEDLFWYGFESGFCDRVLIPAPVFAQAFMPDTYPYEISYNSCVYFDYQKLRPTEAAQLAAAVERYMLENATAGFSPFTENITEKLGQFRTESEKLSSTLLVLQVPVLVLLAAFIFMVSRQMLQMEANEIAVLKSRGAGRRQIIGLYLLQSLVLLLPAAIVGYPLGYVVCRVVGSADSFLEFVQRAALPVRFSWKSAAYAGAALLLSCGAMVLPVIRYARLSIVEHKVSRQAAGHNPLWYRFGFDLIFLAASLYALYSFHRQSEYLASQLANGGSLDPLLYFSSALFIVGAGLLGIRLVWLGIRLWFRIRQKHCSPGAYAAFLQVIRTRSSQTFIMLFLIFTIALGIYNSTAARSINRAREAAVQYNTGADVVLQEVWTKRNGLYVEPRTEKYRTVPGLVSLTKVYRLKELSFETKDGTLPAEVMGIHTKEFGETARFDTSLLPQHWYHYLNAMSQDPKGVILSANFQEIGYQVGDTLEYDTGTRIKQGVIYGFVDYWPGYSPKKIVSGEDGTQREEANYLIVAHRDYVMNGNENGQPYQVWIRMDGSTKPLYDFAQEQGIYFSEFEDLSARLIEAKNDPILLGTNGVLTVDFILILTVCMMGFLIYWILAIRARELSFGIFRAMGLSLREIVGMLLREQLFVSGSAVLVGIGTGAAVTALYLPMVQMAYTTADQVLPLKIVTEASDFIRLFGVIGVVIGIGIAVLAWIISRIRMTQALKLGED